MLLNHSSTASDVIGPLACPRMAWLLTLRTPTDQVEILSSWLWDQGTSGIFERPSNDVQTELVAGFDTKELAQRVRLALPRVATAVDLAPAPPAEHWVDPTHVVDVALGPDQKFQLRPGAAFGHGGHPTTRLTLELLARRHNDTLIPQLATSQTAMSQVLDVGCGTGVLTIAALLLGASHATAVDVEPSAIEQTRSNLTTAGLDERATVVLDDVSQLTSGEHLLGADTIGYDLIMANVLLPVHQAAAQIIADLMAADGELLTSGYLVEQQEQILESYSQLSVIASVESEGWAAHRFGG